MSLLPERINRRLNHASAYVAMAISIPIFWLACGLASCGFDPFRLQPVLQFGDPNAIASLATLCYAFWCVYSSRFDRFPLRGFLRHFWWRLVTYPTAIFLGIEIGGLLVVPHLTGTAEDKHAILCYSAGIALVVAFCIRFLIQPDRPSGDVRLSGAPRTSLEEARRRVSSDRT